MKYEEIIKALKETRKDINKTLDIIDAREENEYQFEELILDFKSILEKFKEEYYTEKVIENISYELFDDEDLFEIIYKLENLICDAEILEIPESTISYYKKEIDNLYKLSEETKKEINQLLEETEDNSNPVNENYFF